MASREETTRAVLTEDLLAFDVPAAVPAPVEAQATESRGEPSAASVESTEPRGAGASVIDRLSSSPMATVEGIRDNKYNDGLSSSSSSGDGVFATPVAAEPVAVASHQSNNQPLYAHIEKAKEHYDARPHIQKKQDSPKNKVQFVAHAPTHVHVVAHGKNDGVNCGERKTEGWYSGARIGWTIFWIILFAVAIIAVLASSMLSIGQKIGAAFFLLVLLALILYATNLKKPYPDIRPPGSPGNGGRPPCPGHSNKVPPTDKCYEQHIHTKN